MNSHDPFILDRYGDLRNAVMTESILPMIKKDIQDAVNGRLFWRKTGNIIEGIAHVLVGISAIVAFSAGFYEHKWLTFLTACLNVVCVVMLRFSTYSIKESTERNKILSNILTSIGLNPTENSVLLEARVVQMNQ